MAKVTYGTGAFILMNTGNTPVVSQNGLLTTIGWSLHGKVTYCLEGSVFIAGAAVQWLRDGLGLIKKSSDIQRLAAGNDSGGVYFVPAFVGLGAPHWDPYARGAILGLERSTTAGHLAVATVESMAFRTGRGGPRDGRGRGVALRELRVDGGAAVNRDLLQFQADLLGTDRAAAASNRNHGAGCGLPGRVGRGSVAQPARNFGQLEVRLELRSQE